MHRLTFAAGFALATFCAPMLAQAEIARTISVTGEGRAAVTPDFAWVDIGVTHQDRDADAALDAMSVALAAVLERLSTSGIAAPDVQTSQVRLDVQYNYSSVGSPTVEGFVASSNVQVRVRDLSILGKVLNAAVGDGANQIGGIRFDVADRESALNTAREMAVADAMARAELFAWAASVPLGELLTLTESGGNSAPAPMMEARMAMDSSAVPIAIGELEISASVAMVFAIGG